MWRFQHLIVEYLGFNRKDTQSHRTIRIQNKNQPINKQANL